MAVLFLFATLIDREADIFNLLAFAALVLFLLNPLHLWDIGFQLSFVAVGFDCLFRPETGEPVASAVGGRGRVIFRRQRFSFDNISERRDQMGRPFLSRDVRRANRNK